MSTSSAPAPAIRAQQIPIIGGEHVPSGGALIIPSQLDPDDLMHLAQALAGRTLVFLAEKGAGLPPGIKEHVEAMHARLIEWDPKPGGADALRKEIDSHTGGGALVIQIPAAAAVAPAQLCTTPGTKLDALMKTGAPVLPLYVMHMADVTMGIEQQAGRGEAVMAFGPLLVAPTVAAYQESLMLLSEQAFTTLPILERSIGYAMLQGFKKFGGSLSVVDGKDDQVLRYDQVLASAIVLSKHIRRSTNKPRVGIILPPGIAGLVANVAAMLAGKTPVNFNFTAGRSSVESAIKQSEVDHFLTADLFVRKMQSFPWPPNRQLTFIERLLPHKGVAIAWWRFVSWLMPAGVLAMILGVAKKGGPKEAVLLFTSGSSGEPKGVVLTHRNLMANLCQFGARLNMNQSDAILGSLPLFHSFGSTVTLWFPIIQGLGLVTYPTPIDTKKLAELMQKHRVTLLLSTPTFLRSYLKGVNPELLASLKLVVTGAEKLPRALADAFEARFGKKVYEGYGLTETSPVSNLNVPDPDPLRENGPVVPASRPGSVGQLIPGLALRITDPETGAPVSVHQTGMIWFKGPNVFDGYLKNPKKTEEAIKDGWFLTGDIGRMDADGFLYIEGRLSRFSKIGGEMVPHETVEDALLKALELEGESSRRIAVVGVPDVEKGEALVLLSTLGGGSTQQEILDLRYKLLDHGIPPLWIPKKILRVPDIPVLASGKLDVKACEKLVKAANL